MNKPIVFFDGYCALCNRFVNLLMRWDKKNIFNYASLQGETACHLFPGGELEKYDSIVFYSDGQVHYKSRAILQIINQMGGWWKLFYITKIFPVFIRDFVYDVIAANRYKLFGKLAQCRIPTEQEKNKLLP
jgi:predicted DCC family thiol-disulfide oxidoreductase YuxK